MSRKKKDIQNLMLPVSVVDSVPDEFFAQIPLLIRRSHFSNKPKASRKKGRGFHKRPAVPMCNTHLKRDQNGYKRPLCC